MLSAHLIGLSYSPQSTVPANALVGTETDGGYDVETSHSSEQVAVMQYLADTDTRLHILLHK